MNLLLDSNVEALAFNYLNFGLITILNNLWTWLALLTAALSFWKIRSSGCPKEPISIKADTCVSISTISVNDEMTEIETPIKKTSTEIFDGVDGVMKGKFTVYFKDDMQCGLIDSTSCYDRLLPVAEGWEQEGELEWCKCWEKVLRLRNGVTENGWYTCQDLTELNGNVVKIWDGEVCW